MDRHAYDHVQYMLDRSAIVMDSIWSFSHLVPVLGPTHTDVCPCLHRSQGREGRKANHSTLRPPSSNLSTG